MATPTEANPLADSLLTGENAAWADETYRRWLRDPSSVDAKWGAVFEEWARDERDEVLRAPPGPSGTPRSIFAPLAGAPSAAAPQLDQAAVRRQSGVVQLINAFRVRGHTEAQIDPLGQQRLTAHPELQLGFYGLSDADLDEVVHTGPLFGAGDQATLRQVLARLRRAYCSGFGVEFMNIGDIHKKRWLQERLETLQDRPALSKPQLLRMLRLMSDAENFERMLHSRFPGTKRFSVEGAETLVPLLDLLLGETGGRGVEEVLIGMAHRGRLNVLANILEKPVRQIVEEFAGTAQRPSQTASGDVKYHLGYSALYRTQNGQELLLSLAFNPSHLEAVDPVVEGRARARMERRGDPKGHSVMPVLIHGDAAFAGQGMVAEVLNLSDLHGYRTGGTVHIIVNNQIGFTTSPADARSTPYCTDVARMLSVPIFHVNGEDVEAVAAVVKLAAEWRQTFHEDVVIDMYCYRKHGHNEGDEPSFTQPLLYEAIRRKESPCVIYARAMVEQMKAISKAEAEAVAADSLARLDACLAEPLGPPMPPSPRFEVTSLWARYLHGDVRAPVDTTFPLDRLRAMLLRGNTIPEGFAAHAKIKRLMSARLAMVHGEAPVDWAVAEQAAYATLLSEGFGVRISGQDSGRGTFSHRHAVLTDTKTGDEYAPLAHISDEQAAFAVYDSLLSEAAVLGFEYGFTLEAPDTLVIWEAQFGDFANGAQVIIDNFIVSGEQKWQRCSGVVMLLPHGFEGQGPEHSSARLERYLQSCAEDNIIVANCTTPASFFHLLRRQVKWGLRKPLVVMSPKSLLRHPGCTSTLEELAEGRFDPVLPDPDVQDAEAVRRVVLCSGKVYYELKQARGSEASPQVALIRVEQLYPFPAEALRAALAAFSPEVELVWCQEEPRNMGAWPMYDEWLLEGLGRQPRYVGRKAAAAPATGYPEKHKEQHERLLHDALHLS
jgi:2-oxoglutarate dehydrogenase E1 component